MIEGQYKIELLNVVVSKSLLLFCVKEVRGMVKIKNSLVIEYSNGRNPTLLRLFNKKKKSVVNCKYQK
jgi:hypothetical protein